MTRCLLLLPTTICLCLSGVPAAFAQGAPGNRSDLTLLDRGSEPRRELRYGFVEGSSENAAMDMNIDMSLSMGGAEIQQVRTPTIRLVVNLDQVEVGADRTARYEFEIGELELVDNADTDPALAETFRASLGEVPSVSGWARIDSLGSTLDGGANLADGIDPQLGQVFESAEQSLQQLSAPLPDEAVGIGASWQHVQDIESAGFDVRQTATYTIVAMAGQNLSLDVSIAQTAPAQSVEMPGMPPGAGASLESLETTGNGSMQIDLSRFVPRSNLSMIMRIGLGISAGAENQQIDMTMQTDIAITPIE